MLITENQSQVDSVITQEEALEMLTSQIRLTKVIDMAYEQRFRYFQNKVRIHVLDNVRNGFCPEDCGYCAQRKDANSGVQNYSLKPLDDIYKDALDAKKSGAYRFCIVSSGTGPNDAYIEKLAPLVERITKELNLKVCLSAGILDHEKAERLRKAGLDRYNHNLNTSEDHYSEICSTHTYKDRVNTLEHIHSMGISACSGLIIGLGESNKDIVQIAFDLKRLKVISIPVNFFIPVAGHAIKNPNPLTPEFCLRVLSVFRLINPDSEIRVAAGREGHLKSMQSLSLFPANSLFASGYLNVKGSDMYETVKMIKETGFEPDFEDSNMESNITYTEENIYSENNIQNLYKHKKG